MQRFSLTLELYPDAKLIAEYVERHRHVWPEVQESLRASGVINMEIYHLGTRLVMIMDTTDDFTFERKAELDRANPVVMQWEREMAKYQSADPAADASGKWQLMDNVFSFAANPDTDSR